MPHHKAFKKTLITDKKKNLRNKDAESRLRTMIKKVRTATNKEEAEAALKTAFSVIDSTARKNILKKNTASRKKSRLAKFVAKIS